MSIGLSDLIWEVFITIMDLINEKNKKLNFLVDAILININCDRNLQLNQITYFDDIIIRFHSVEKVAYRGKTHYFVNAYVSKSKIMLPA